MCLSAYTRSFVNYNTKANRERSLKALAVIRSITSDNDNYNANDNARNNNKESTRCMDLTFHLSNTLSVLAFILNEHRSGGLMS